MLAKDLDETIEIAKANPLFDLAVGGRLEVRIIETIDEVNIFCEGLWLTIYI